MRPAPPVGRGVAAGLGATVCFALLAACSRTEETSASRGGVKPPVAATASAAESTVAQAGLADRVFVANAAAAAQFDVQLGQMAGAQSIDPAVKSFASMLVDDLVSANTELAQLAAARGITLPTQPSREAQADLKKLGRENGPGFDRGVADLAVRTHRHDVDEFENAARHTQDDELKAWIERALPTLRQHLGEAEKLVAAIGAAPGPADGSGSTAGSVASGRSAASAGGRTSVASSRTPTTASRQGPASAAGSAGPASANAGPPMPRAASAFPAASAGSTVANSDAASAGASAASSPER